MSPIRRRYGLHWKGSRLSWYDIAEQILNVLITILAVSVFLLLLGWLDARDAKLTAEIEADKATRDFANFLNGGTIVGEGEKFAARCSYLIEVTDK